MGKTIIGEETFPKIIEEYNSGGKTAAYDYLRSQYGIKHPYCVITRIKKCGKLLGSGEKGHSESGEKGHFSVRKKGPTHQRLFYSDYWLLATMESSFTCLHS